MISVMLRMSVETMRGDAATTYTESFGVPQYTHLTQIRLTEPCKYAKRAEMVSETRLALHTIVPGCGTHRGFGRDLHHGDRIDGSVAQEQGKLSTQALMTITMVNMLHAQSTRSEGTARVQ